MAKRFLSIFLGLMLLVSCMPAMAYDYVGEDGSYTIDLSGAAPVLKLNGAAVEGKLSDRGTVAIADDPTGSGEKVLKLTNSDSLDTTYSLESTYKGVGSALLVNMGDEALKGNVVVKFKFYDGRYTGELRASGTMSNKHHRPLHLSDTYAGDPYFLANTRGGNWISKYNSDVERAPILVGSKWHDYTVLIDTESNKFKAWIDGTQFLSQNNSSEWFDLTNIFDVTNGITNINFSNYYTPANTHNDGDVYFKDMSFGVCSGNTEEWCPNNLISETFDNTFSAATVNNYVTCHKTQNSWTKSDSGLYLTSPSSTSENLILENKIPTSTSNAPGTGYAFRTYNDSVNGYSFHGAFIGFGRITNATTVGTKVDNVTVTPAYEECLQPLAIEFDFCNMTQTSGLKTRPVTLEFSGNKRDMNIVSFDDSGIYVGEACVKNEDTRGKWYNIRIVYNPNSDTCKVYINDEVCNIEDLSVADYALNRIDLGTGKGYLEIKEEDETTKTNPLRRGVREVYFDNIKIYNYDNNLVIEDVTFAEVDGTLSFSGNVVNKLDAEASVSAYPIIAVYNKETGALENVTIGDTVDAENNGTPVTVSASISEGLPANYTAKAFVWKGEISNLLPFKSQSYFGKFTYSK